MAFAAYHPTFADQIRRERQRPAMPAELAFCLLPGKPEDGTRVSPLACADLPALARAIHRRRGQRGLELWDAPLRLGHEAEARAGVTVWILGDDGQRRECLGWAWLDGRGRDALAAALGAAQPQAVEF